MNAESRAIKCVRKIFKTMNELQLTQALAAKAEMLIRKPPLEVFEAFVGAEAGTHSPVQHRHREQ
jgi:hypothetical protein